MLMKPHHIDQSEQGDKTLTTRLMLPGEYVADGVWYTAGGRRKHYAGAIRLLSPKRGEKGIARIEVLELWEHPLQAMTTYNIIDESIPLYKDEYGYTDFIRIKLAWIDLWDSINKRQGTRWADNPRTVSMRYKWLGRIDV